ncbi:MAG: heterodisulfide reductase-related iron-sulfur binding cluster [archaeon]|nr:heterodisulfide reductase-related iron-sulfur binding cluster [archaeon]
MQYFEFSPYEEWLPLCPSGQFYGYQAFYAPGRLEIFREILEGELSEPSDGLLKAAYACTLCGACYEKCKQITSVEIRLPELFEELRRELVKKGWILDAHKNIVEKIKETRNAYGEKVEYRAKSVYGADVLYFIGCTARYRVPEIADAMLQIFDNLGIKYQVMDEEWCCGSVLLRTGQIEAAKELMEHNIEAIKRSGANTVVFTCPGCLNTIEKDYPDMGVELVHSTQFLTRLGNMKVKRLDMKVAYHDPCHLGRDLGIYDAPRTVLKEVADVKEMKREREQAWCCGSGGGVKSAFDEFALWSAVERIKEAKEAGAEALVSACPFCKRGLREAGEKEGMKVYDVVELVNKGLEG